MPSQPRERGMKARSGDELPSDHVVACSTPANATAYPWFHQGGDMESSTARQVTRNCHWVPQSYLKAFAVDGEGKRIWRSAPLHEDDEPPAPELKRIAKVAVRNHLYVPIDPATGRRDDRMERKLSDLERWFGSDLWKELASGCQDLSWEPLRKMVSLLVAVMQLRNPMMFDQHQGFHAMMRNLIEDMARVPCYVLIDDKRYELDVNTWPHYREATPEDVHREWVESLDSATWLAQELMGMRWSMLIADKPTFITSDNPVVIRHPSGRFQGIRNPETLLFFPVSPTRCLTMDHLLSEPTNQYYSVQHDGVATNALISMSAYAHIFCGRDPSEVRADILGARPVFEVAQHRG